MTKPDPVNLVITLIADAKRERLTQAFVDSMVPTLALQGIRVDKTDWLAEEIACDLFVSSADEHVVGAYVEDIMRDQPYDAVTQLLSHRRKKLLICDMDSTMITIECIDELADFVGKKAEVAAITERAMNGELNFEAALRERVILLKGLPEVVLQQCYDERVKMMPGAKQLVQTMRHHGAHAILVSGGFTFFTSRVAAELGFHEHYANTLIVRDGKLTGEVQEPILGKEAKLRTLNGSCKKLGISADEVLAVGDGANDLPMLLAAGFGVAYHAKPVVRAQAKARINHCDLSALLWAQEYRKEDIRHR